MDRSDKKTSEFERRASRRLSRGVSIHAGADTSDAIDDDAYLAAMAMTVSDGFRPYTETTTVPSAGTPGAHNSISLRTKDTDDSRRSDSVSSTSHDDDHLSTTTAADAAASSISTDPFSSSSSSASSSASASSSPSHTFATPSSSQTPNAPVPEPQPTESLEPASSSNASLPALSAQARSLAAARPSSIAKPPIDHMARSVPFDGTSAGGSSNTRSLADVRASASSSVAPAHEEEPYQGPSGPSFPYQMYPQNVRMARTLSGVTTSTVAPSESTYNGPRGPTFPYAMYPQNTVAGPSAMPAPVPGISVGFPGMADNYQRRIGPDGEDVADLIGPDGHTEQLPPYTRYPDEAYNRKIAAANAHINPDPLADPLANPLANPMSAPNTVPIAVPASEPLAAQSVPPASATVSAPAAVLAPAPAHVSTSPAPISPIPGAGGIGLAPHNPEFDGVEEAESPHSRYSLRSFNSDASGHEINTAARNINEKRKHRAPRFIQKYGGRRMLGIIPYWAICLVFTALLLMGIVLGSVIGTFVAKHKKAQQLHHPYACLPIRMTSYIA
ncbi:hypothetical protein SEUCBS140593_006966 [Sporothrix eucalyptigena]|uniref:Uncharacterized protein n=1 Tax=Sporothrix eucalyptigena TaxID=1812306 RepID=A0ABP0C9A7_9PEZI